MKILLADESITIRKVVQIIYRGKDVEIACANDHEDMMTSAKSFEPDIVLLSTTFPGLDVKADLKRLPQGKNGVPIPVVLLANRGDQIDKEASKPLGAAGFLYKPLDNRELTDTIDRVISEADETPEEMETSVHPPVTDTPEQAPVVHSLPEASPGSGTPEQRAQIMMEIMESYLNENTVLIVDALSKNISPKLAPEIAGKIIESMDFSELSYKIAAIVEGVIQELVPKLAEELIMREINSMKEEVSRLMTDDESSQD